MTTASNSLPLIPRDLQRQSKSVRAVYRELRGRGAINSFLPVSVSELARAMGVHSTTIYRAAKTLERLGYLRRLPQPDGTAWTLYDAPPRINGKAR